MIDSSMLTKSIPLAFHYKLLKTFLFIEDFLFLTFLKDENEANVSIIEIKINLNSFQIENKIDYMIVSKQKQVIFSDLLFDISHFYAQSLNLFNLDGDRIQMKEVLLIKENFIVKINDKSLTMFFLFISNSFFFTK